MILLNSGLSLFRPLLFEKGFPSGIGKFYNTAFLIVGRFFALFLVELERGGNFGLGACYSGSGRIWASEFVFKPVGLRWLKLN